MGTAWENAIRKEFIDGLIGQLESLKRDYDMHTIEEFYREAGKIVVHDIYATYEKDVEPK